MQANISTNSFIGRDTAGSGSQETLTLPAARTLLNVEDGSTADQDASEVPFTPTGLIGSTDVQAAIAEVDGEKLAKASNLSDLSSASTSRSNLGISATNTPSDATGDIVATDVQSAIAELDSEKKKLDSRLVKAVGGASDVTLTSGEADNSIIELTGVLTGNINVIIPDTIHIVEYFNNTTGAFTLTVKTLAGIGPSIEQGLKARISSDGTNAVILSNNLANNLNIGNTTSTTLDVLSDVGTDATVPSATVSDAGLLSAADKVVINSIPTKVSQEDIDAIDQTPNANTVVATFVYDTTRDSDGGAWRKSTTHTSWYNETLNTATRGATREFPAVALVVAEADKVTIYDATVWDCPMWIVFERGDDYLLIPSVFANVSSLSAQDGVLAVGTDNRGLQVANFVTDTGFGYRDSGTKGRGNFNGNIGQRNQALDHDGVAVDIVNSAINDIAITVLPNAPIDEATGLPISTIAVATDSGISIITDSGDVWDIERAVPAPATKVTFLATGGLAFLESGAQYQGVNTLPTADLSVWPTGRDFIYNGIGSLATKGVGSSLLDSASGGTQGVTLLKEDVANPFEGMVNYITSDFQSGWMKGDIKLAALADTVAETIGVDETTELVTNGGFDTDLTG